MNNNERFYFQMEKNEEYKLKTNEDYEKIAKSTYEAAIGFYIISQKCLDMILSKYNNQICTNIAFACELFFKSILFKSEIDCRKQHNLYLLYELLSDEQKKSIKKLHKSGNINKEDFDLNLKEISKAFIVLRYSYERKKIAYNLQFLLELIMALNDYCITIFEK